MTGQRPDPGPGSFGQLDESLVHQGAVISLAIGRFAGPGGERFTREVVRHPGAVSVVPLHDDGTVVLVRQYRAPLDRFLLEIPAGKRDVPGEPPEVTAGRELEEEVGLRAGQLVKLAEFHNSPGFCDEHSHVYLGTGLEAVPSSAHSVEEEHLSVEQVALDDVGAMIADGRITDAKTIIGLSLTLLRRGLRTAG